MKSKVCPYNSMLLVYHSHEAFLDSITTQAQKLIEKSLDLHCRERYVDPQDSFYAFLKSKKMPCISMKSPPSNTVNTNVEALIAAHIYIVLGINGNQFTPGE